MPGGPLEVPRVAWNPRGCDQFPGPCPSQCTTAPDECADDACSALVIDTGSPFAMFAGHRAEASVGRECIEIRNGKSSTDDTIQAEPSTVRFRFENVPAIRVPTQASTRDVWLTQYKTSSSPGWPPELSYASGVLGGMYIASFALQFTDDKTTGRSLRIYHNYPDVELRPSASAPANIIPQYPGRLLGRERGDDCRLGGQETCAIAGSVNTEIEEARINAPSLLVADACIAPPPCEVVHRGEDWPGQADGRTCDLQRSPLDGRSCVAIDDRTLGGSSASLLVATGVPGTILFGDSVRRLFGAIDELEVCPGDEGMAPDQRLCRLPEAAELTLVGWGHLSGLVQLRLRGVALIAGANTSDSSPPCTRLAHRVDAALDSCNNYLRRGRPDDDLDEDVEFDETRDRLGQVDFAWLSDTPERTITAIVLPETTPYARAIRRVTGAAALELDGVMGTTLLQGTDVVFDYAESDVDPGLRIRCTDSGDSGCSTAAACIRDGEGSSDSCCQGIPRYLIEDTIRRKHSGLDPTAPSGEDRCCNVLDAEVLANLRATFAQACPLGPD